MKSMRFGAWALILVLALTVSCGAATKLKTVTISSLLTIPSGATLEVATGGTLSFNGSAFVPGSLAYLAAVTPGTAAASKAVVLNSSSQIDTLTTTGALTVGGAFAVGTGYSGSGGSWTALGALSTKGALIVDGAGTIAGNATFGAGYSTSGASITASNGNIATKGTLTVDSTSTFTGTTSFGGISTGPGGGSILLTKYQRVTIDAINTAAGDGVTILPAVAGRSYRVVNMSICAYAAAVTATATATGLKIVTDPTGTPVILYSVNLAQLGRSVYDVAKPTTASTTVLADDASFTAQVANKKIVLMGISAGTYDLLGTGVDVSIQYTVE